MTAKELTIKEKIEYWWYFGDQHKTEKIVFIIISILVFSLIIFPIIQAILGGLI